MKSPNISKIIKEDVFFENFEEYFLFMRSIYSPTNSNEMFQKIKNSPEVKAWLKRAEPNVYHELKKISLFSEGQYLAAMKLIHNKNKGKIGLEGFVGYEKQKKYMKERILPVFKVLPSLKDKYKNYNFPSYSGVLLYGPPGCGKSYLAQRMADELDFYFQTHVVERSIEVEGIFDFARKMQNMVIFFDDFENVGEDRMRNYQFKLITSAMLTQMDGCKTNENNLLMAGTNYPWNIDPAMFRPGRFEHLVYLGLPDNKSRLELINYYLKNSPVGDLDTNQLVEKTDMFSCADIKSLCQSAAIVSLQKTFESNDGELVMIDNSIIESILKKSNPSGVDWYKKVKEINFGPFADLFPEMMDEIEKLNSEEHNFKSYI